MKDFVLLVPRHPGRMKNVVNVHLVYMTVTQMDNTKNLRKSS